MEQKSRVQSPAFVVTSSSSVRYGHLCPIAGLGVQEGSVLLEIDHGAEPRVSQRPVGVLSPTDGVGGEVLPALE